MAPVRGLAVRWPHHAQDRAGHGTYGEIARVPAGRPASRAANTSMVRADSSIARARRRHAMVSAVVACEPLAFFAVNLGQRRRHRSAHRRQRAELCGLLTGTRRTPARPGRPELLRLPWSGSTGRTGSGRLGRVGAILFHVRRACVALLGEQLQRVLADRGPRLGLLPFPQPSGPVSGAGLATTPSAGLRWRPARAAPSAAAMPGRPRRRPLREAPGGTLAPPGTARASTGAAGVPAAGQRARRPASRCGGAGRGARAERWPGR